MLGVQQSQGASRHKKFCSNVMLLNIIASPLLYRFSHSWSTAAGTAHRLGSLFMQAPQTCFSCPARGASAWALEEQENAQQQQQAPSLTPKTLAATQAGAFWPVSDGRRAAAEVGCPVR